MTWISASFNGLTSQAQKRLNAGTTLRLGGVSKAPYDSFNLALHVGDESTAVEQNRRALKSLLGLPQTPAWLNQTHTNICIEVPTEYQLGQECDASFTREAGQVCCVMTADCLPIIITNTNADFVATIHAGWRGLANGIVERSVHKISQRYALPIEQFSAWIGPAIGPEAFEVGPEVKAEFIKLSSELSKHFKRVNGQEGESSQVKYLADLPGLGESILKQLGVHLIRQSKICTFQQPQFYSYRRDGQTGRMATLAWLK